MTLEKLLQDGRIHPARIEETYYQAKSELEGHIVELGEEAVFEADVHGLDPELVEAARPPALPHVATARTCSRTRSSARSSPR